MRRPQSVFEWITLGLQIILVAGLILSAARQQWLNVLLTGAVIVLTALPALMERQFKVTIPPEFELLAILFVFASLFLGEVREYYVRFWWWDALLHTGSGLLLGLVAFLLVYLLNQLERIDLHLKPGFVALFSFGFAMAVGSLWEIFEFGMDSSFGLNMQKSGLNDTMWDLIVDALGAFVFSVTGYLYMSRGWGSPIFRSVESFVRSNPEIFGGDENAS
ncbi:MAG: hypothetical protein WD423_08395 [Rhodothermales bacterium]